MRTRRAGWWMSAIGAIALFLLIGSVTPAGAHARVFIGGAFGVPVYPYYYPYPYPYYPYAAYPYDYGVPPPGWDPGHWERRQNRWGRWVEVWVPPHLR